MPKGKEFWTHIPSEESMYLAEKLCHNKEFIHVIEKSAYDKAIEALKEITDSKHFQVDREHAFNSASLRAVTNWTKETAKHLFLKGWDNRAYIAEQTLKDLGEAQ